MPGVAERRKPGASSGRQLRGLSLCCLELFVLRLPASSEQGW